MPIGTTNAYSGPYTANGVTVSFPFTFQVLTTDQVQVRIDGAVVSPSAYSVTLSGSAPSTGNVVFGTAPASGSVYVLLNPAFSQDIEFADGAAWLAKPVNDGYDQGALRDQALRRDTLRALKAPLGEVPGELPAAAARAGKFLAFDASGNPLMSSGTGADAGLRTDLALSTGAALTGASDGAGGTLWTTVQGFITKLISSTGAAVIGFVQAGTGAVIRNVLAKLRDNVISPEDFGAVAVEDGNTTGTGNNAAILAALASGRIVDGNGKTYALTAGGVLVTAITGMQRCFFKWGSTTAMAQQTYLVTVRDVSNFFIRHCGFDLGTVADCGGATDDGRGGLFITTSNPNVTFNENVDISDNWCTGYGNGTGIHVRSCKRVTVVRNRVYGRRAAATPDPTNDCQDGIQVTYCTNAVISQNNVYDCQTKIGGVYKRFYSRGILIVGVRDSTVLGNVVNGVDQAFDFSGGVIGGLDTTGNVRIAVVGNSASVVRTWGLKFANAFRDSTVVGNVVQGYGLGGIVFSGASVTPTDPRFNTQNVLVTGNHLVDATGEYSGGGCRGIQILEASAVSPTYPRGIRIFDNLASEPSAGGFVDYCFRNESTYTGTNGDPNELKNCRGTGYSAGVSTGFKGWRTNLSGTGTQSIPNTTATTVVFNTVIEDGIAAYNAANGEVTIKVGGWYEVNTVANFASNATGYRQANVMKNGGTTGGLILTANAVNGAPTAFSGKARLKLAKNDILRVDVTQNSGGALNFDLGNSRFSVELVEIG